MNKKEINTIQYIMKYYPIYLLLTMCSLLFSLSASAHALWIESEPLATKGVAHEVKIFYGEYATHEIESLEKWYSDVKAFKIILTTPSQKRIELSKEAHTDFFKSTFTPKEDGVYTLSIVHPAMDLGGTTKYEFSSAVLVKVGQPKVQTQNLPFYIHTEPKVFEEGQIIDAFVLQNGKPSPNTDLLVMSQEGWSKTLRTDDQGKVSFPAIWKGRYVLEASLNKDESGQWHNKSYSKVWQGTTSSIIVQ